MNFASVVSPRHPVRVFRPRAVSRALFRSFLATAALAVPAFHPAAAQSPGSRDTGFTPTTVAATVYATIFQQTAALPGATPAKEIIFAAGDVAFDQNLNTDGSNRYDFVSPTYGNGNRIIFTAVTELVVDPGFALKKIIIGGAFGESAAQALARVGAQNILRIDPDGTEDTTFNPGVGANNFVTSIVPLAGGSMVVGGEFTSFNQEPRLRIVRLLTNGKIDETFANGLDIDGDVLTMAQGIKPGTTSLDGTTLVGGDFNHVAGKVYGKLVRLDANGNLDASFHPVIDTRVNAIVVQPTGKIIIGGEFANVNGKAVSHIARLNYDGSLDTTFAGAVTGEPVGEPNPVAVYVFNQLSDGHIYVGGNFTQIDGATRRYLGVINANGTVGAFDPGTTIYDKVQSIYVQPNNGKILVGESLGPKIGKTYQPTLIRLYGVSKGQ